MMRHQYQWSNDDIVQVNMDDIERSDRIEELREFYQSFDLTCDDIESQIAARASFGEVDEDWRARAATALGAARMGRARVVKRLLALGVDLRTTRTELEVLKAAVGKHREEMNTLKGRIAMAARFAKACRSIVGEETYRRIQVAAADDLDRENTHDAREMAA